ncbi:SHOCT domain-containing protein [Rhodococcus sp. I2R]|uniref:SHOCT domain-containing protein n=1 Tax=Rhodococcus sp. I2R TaxID=2855445 RepID=UPI001E5E680E|nr:SHOCT domain-containing protein [Rhodococcus sp. I2R]MCC8929829.1 SHOCT domain-containing protein [Rhodococcus sp. I2R]
MHHGLTPAGENAVSELAGKYAISTDAVRAMLDAVNSGRGTMAQFNVAELGGSGQWMRGGMTMVGNMFDHGLKARVDGLCRDLSELLANNQVYPPAHTNSRPAGSWWPNELGSPSSSGGQNGSQYAYFPSARRLAILANGRLSVFDTLDHSIGGVQQAQGAGPGSLEFTSQFGTFTAASLPLVDPGNQNTPAPQQPAPQQPAPQQPAPQQPAPQQTFSQPAPQASGSSEGSMSLDEVTSAIEALASLHNKGILTDAEFETKKAQLLGRI